ncbi:MAG: metallophosphoesterase family protein [Desulfobacteraceae bacterium]
MKIGVIADTHLKQPTRELERVLETVFSDVDLIVHAGDFNTEEVLEVFSGKDLVAVKGNNDSPGLKKRLPESVLFEAGGFRIGVVHGCGPPFGIRSRVISKVQGADCVVYGHSHLSFIGYFRGALFFNPGAFCGGVLALGRRSVGILRVEKEIQGQVIRI